MLLRTASGTSNQLQIIILAYVTFIALGLPSGMLGVAWPSIRDTFGVTDAALGTLLLPVTLGYLTASVLNGTTISRLGVGTTMIVASSLSMLGILGYGLATNWWLLIAVGLVLGLGQGIVDSSMNLFFANHFSPRLMNWLHASFGLGAALGPLVMTQLFTLGQSWRWGYVIFAAVQLLLTFSFIITRQRWQMRITDTAPGDSDNTALPLRVSIRQPLVLLSILLFFVFTGVETIAGNWGFTLLTEARAADEVAAGQWISLYWWSFTLGRIIFGFIADHIPIASTIRTCLLLVVFGGIFLTINLNNMLSLTGLILIGFALAPIFPLLITSTPNRLGRHATNAIGFQIGAAGLSLAALPALAGVLATIMSLEIIGPYLIITTLLALICFQILNWQTISR